jgi:hypothetical protein
MCSLPRLCARCTCLAHVPASEPPTAMSKVTAVASRLARLSKHFSRLIFSWHTITEKDRHTESSHDRAISLRAELQSRHLFSNTIVLY